MRVLTVRFAILCDRKLYYALCILPKPTVAKKFVILYCFNTIKSENVCTKTEIFKFLKLLFFFAGNVRRK